MNLKQLKPKLNFIAKNVRPRLTQIKVNKDSLECHDLETYVKIKNNYGMSEGLQNFKTLGLTNSTNDVDEYPTLNIDRFHTESLLIDLDKLETCLKFASKDETRLYLNGVAINKSHLVATDGHTLKAYKIDDHLESNYIMPRTSLTVLIKLLKGFKYKGIVRLELNETWASVDNAKFTFSMRLIQREFPNWKNVIPQGYNHIIKIDNFNITKEAKPLFKECKRSNACRMVGSEGSVFLIPRNYPNERFLIGKCDHDFEIGFNYSYLERGADKKNAFTFKYNGDLLPCEFNEAIIMPLKL